MGGFVIRIYVPDRHPKLVDDQTHQSNTGPFGQSGIELESTMSEDTQPTSRLIGRDEYSSSNHEASGESAVHYLTLGDLFKLREQKILNRLPDVTKAEINDRSKTDSLLRSLAAIQIMWTAIQILTRAIRHLAIAQLEIAVLAFSVCAIIIYGLNWEKPKSVQVPFTILAYKGDIPETIRLQLRETRAAMTDESWLTLLAAAATFFTSDKVTSSSSPIPNHSSADVSPDGALGRFIGLFLGGSLFSAIHIAAWSFSFPTSIEQTLWRVASVISCTTPLLLGAMMVVIGPPYSFDFDFLVVAVIIFGPIFTVAYFLARLFLMVECFRALFLLPPSAYVTTWATNIPHIS